MTPMDVLTDPALQAYWSTPVVAANVVVILNVLGALVLGLAVGYERSYHGRAAGMRTYGLVCMASAALTVIVGFPGLWFGGHSTAVAADPTRVIQGIVTGIGFLGAGVIVKEGFSISGLNTAASIWAASAIGVLIGLGFYAAAISLAALSAVCMAVIPKIEQYLPAHSEIAVSVLFQKGFSPNEEIFKKVSIDFGYEIARGSLSIRFKDGQSEWQFVAFTRDRKGASIPKLAHAMCHYEGVASFNAAPARH
jgi:putative Mg2+ transporter-C (MgtC) family protein